MRIFLCLLIIFPVSVFSQDLLIHYIDVGQGDAELIQYQNYNYLIDAGVNRGDNKLVNYLDSIGIDTIHAMLLTHPHFDHYGEFEDVIESGIKVLKFIKNKDSRTISTYNSLMNILQIYGIAIDTVDYLDSLNWIFESDILSPNYANGFTDYNNNSIVFKMSFGNLKFLFTGDSETENNNYLINNYNIDVNILKMPHHGADNGFNYSYMIATNPEIAIISSGDNSYGHPSHSVIDMIKANNGLVYSTAWDCSTWTGNGSNDVSVANNVVLRTDGDKVWINEELVINPTFVEEQKNIISNRFNYTIYPNPIKDLYNVSFNIDGYNPQFVNLKIYNVLGQLEDILITDYYQPGSYSILFENKYKNSVYFYHLTVGNEQVIKKVIIN